MGLVLPPQERAQRRAHRLRHHQLRRGYGGIRYDNYGGAGAALGSIVDCFVVGFNNGSPGSAGALKSSSSRGIPSRTARAPGAWRLCRHRWLTLTSNLTSGITYPVLRQGGNGAEQKYAIGAFPERAWGRQLQDRADQHEAVAVPPART